LTKFYFQKNLYDGKEEYCFILFGMQIIVSILCKDKLDLFVSVLKKTKHNLSKTNGTVDTAER